MRMLQDKFQYKPYCKPGQMLFWCALLVASIIFMRNFIRDFLHVSLFQPTSQQLSAPSAPEIMRPTFGKQALPNETQQYRYQEIFTSLTHKQLLENSDWNLDQQALNLALRDQIPQQESMIAGSTAHDSVYVVWRDLRRDAGDIFVQRIDAGGNRLWAQDLRVNMDIGTALQFDPAIAVDSAGSLWVAWVDNRNGNNDIYAQRVSRSGETLWRDDKQLNRDDNNADQGGVSIALIHGQGAVVAWHDNRSGNYDLYMDRVSESGAFIWAENLRVNSVTENAQTYPSVAANATGTITVAWLDQRIGNSDIYLQRLSATGQPLWSSEVRVNQPAEAAQSHPSLAINQSDGCWVVWVAQQNQRLLAQQIDANGKLQQSNAVGVSPLYQPVDANQQPFLIAVNDGNFVSAWADSGNGNLYAQHFNSQGTSLWNQPALIHRFTTSKRAERNRVTLATAHGAFVLTAWTEKRIDNQEDVYSQALDQTGSPVWAQDMLINEQSGKVDQQLAAVAALTDGGYVVAWQDWRSGVATLYLQRLTTNGALAWSSQIQATSAPTSLPITTGQLVPSITSVGTDTVIVWADERTASSRLYAQRFDQAGSRLWSQDQPIGHPTDPAVAQLNPALTSDQQGRIFVVWEEIHTTQRQLLIQQLGATGAALWSKPIAVPTGSAPRLPTIKAGKDNFLYLAWLEKSVDGANIYLERASSEGVFTWTSPRQGNRTTDEVNSLTPPALGVDDAGNSVVVWVGRQAGSIMTQRLNASGQPLWSNDITLNSIPGGFAPLPDIAMLPNGNAIVVWQQLFEKHYTIAAQSLDTAGNTLWNDTLTNSKEVILSVQSDGAQRPKIAFNAQGNSVVIWQDRRFNNWDIVAQQLSSAGELTWPNDSNLVPQERFYFAEGSAESNAIDQTNMEIATAQLSAIYQANGGALQFWLSNNGGRQWDAVTPGIRHRFSTSGSDLRWKVLLQVNPHNLSRSPTVQEITVDYDLAAPSSTDLYEADDDCTQARPLQINGAAQTHTIASSSGLADEDWISLKVSQTTPVSFIAQADALTTSLQLALYSDCGGKPITSASSQGNGVATVIFSGTVSGTAYSTLFLQVRGKDATSLSSAGYSLAAYRPTETPLAVIVAGAVPTNSQVASQISLVVNRAYRTLRKHGYTAETIYFLNNSPEQDADGDGLNDVDAVTSAAELHDALAEWLPAFNAAHPSSLSSSLLLFMVGVEKSGQFQSRLDEEISAEQLNLWLSNAEMANAFEHSVIILEMNQAGRWIGTSPPATDLVESALPNPIATTIATATPATLSATVSGKNRIILTATGAQGAAWHTPSGVLFSDIVWTALDQGASLWESSARAQSIVGQIGHHCDGITTLCQQPWLDDTGDGRANQQDDGTLAQSWRLYPFSIATTPVIQQITIQAEGSKEVQTIDVAILHTDNNTVVDAEIIPPDFTVPFPVDGLPPTTTFPVIRLQPLAPTDQKTNAGGATLYHGIYGGFSKLGVYRIIVYAKSGNDLAAFPVVAQLQTGTRLYLPLISNNP